MHLQLSDHLRAHLPTADDAAFDAVMTLPGEVFRAQKNRRTVRAVIGGRAYFIKTHRPAPFMEIVKNAARLRWPVLTAAPERRAIEKLEGLGVPTTRLAGYGSRGRFPRIESFIITEELAGMIHLSDLPPKLRALPARQRARIQRRLIAEVARIARLLHTSGLNHRDFYLNHFMVPDRDWGAFAATLSENAPDSSPKGSGGLVHLIDLHRVQIRRRTPRQWAVKDISGLLFSAFDADLAFRDWLRFLSIYWGEPWHQRWRAARLWRWQVLRRAVSLYRSERGRSPRLPAFPPSSA